MQIDDALRELKLKLENHHLVTSFSVESVFDEQREKEVVQVNMEMQQLRDCEGDFTQLLRTIRRVIPVHWPVALTMETHL